MHHQSSIENGEEACSIGIVGSPHVGKTELALQFCLARFIKNIPGPPDQKIRQFEVPIGGVWKKVRIIDSQVDPLEFRDCDTVVFVFSTLTRESFDFVKWRASHVAAEHRRSGRRWVLVGTKTDLGPLAVSEEEGVALARQMGSEYFHISTKEIKQTEDLFTHLLTTPRPDKNTSISEALARAKKFLTACMCRR